MRAVSVGSSLRPQPQGNADSNIGYLEVVERDQAICEHNATQFPGTIVLTTWPCTEDLHRLELGCTPKEVSVVPFARGTAGALADPILLCAPLDSLQRALQDPATARNARQLVRIERHAHSVHYSLTAVAEAARRR